MKEKVLGYISKIQNARYFVKLIMFAAVCFVCTVVSFLGTGVTFAYEVEYMDTYVSTISSREDFEAAKELAAKKIACGDYENHIAKHKFNLVVTSKSLSTPASCKMPENLIIIPLVSRKGFWLAIAGTSFPVSSSNTYFALPIITSWILK